MNLHLFLLLNFMFLNHRQHLLWVNLNMGCQWIISVVRLWHPHTLNLLWVFLVRPTLAEQTSLFRACHQNPPRNSVPHIGPMFDEMFDRYVQRWQNWQRSVWPTYQPGQTGSPRPVQSVHPVSLFQTSMRYLHPHSQILRTILTKRFLIIRMIWLICLEKVLEWMLEAKPAHTKSRILLHLIRLHTLLVLGCLSLLNSVGKILGVLLSILVSILPN